MQESCQQAKLHREEHQAAQPLEFNPLQPLALQNKGMLPFPVVFTGILNPSPVGLPPKYAHGSWHRELHLNTSRLQQNLNSHKTTTPEVGKRVDLERERDATKEM